MPHLPSTSQWACPMATQFGTRPKSLGSHGIKQTLFDALFNKQRCAIATTCNKTHSLTPWVQQIHKMQNTHHLCRKARTHAPCVFGVCVCVCVCSLLSFWCFYIFPAWYWQILSRQLKKHSSTEGEHCHPEDVSKMWRHIHSVTDLRTVFVASFIASGQSANCRFWPRTSVDMLGL